MRRIQPRMLGKNKKKQGGFTLIELVVVIIIAGILGAAIVATYVDLTDEAYDADVAQTASSINTGIALYTAKTGGAAPNLVGTTDANGAASALVTAGYLIQPNNITIADTTNVVSVDGNTAGTLSVSTCSYPGGTGVCAVSAS